MGRKAGLATLLLLAAAALWVHRGESVVAFTDSDLDARVAHCVYQFASPGGGHIVVKAERLELRRQPVGIFTVRGHDWLQCREVRVERTGSWPDPLLQIPMPVEIRQFAVHSTRHNPWELQAQMARMVTAASIQLSEARLSLAEGVQITAARATYLPLQDRFQVLGSARVHWHNRERAAANFEVALDNFDPGHP